MPECPEAPAGQLLQPTTAAGGGRRRRALAIRVGDGGLEGRGGGRAKEADMDRDKGPGVCGRRLIALPACQSAGQSDGSPSEEGGGGQ